MGQRRVPRLIKLLPIAAPAVVALAFGLWAGLLRLGFDLEPLRPNLASLHGPLMVLGFLGTQIGLERAVALKRYWWSYIAPAATAAGAVWLLVGFPLRGGQLLLLLGGIGLTAILVKVMQIQTAWHNAVMLLGGFAWIAGVILWMTGTALHLVMPWFAAFLVLTIVAERMELSRMRQPSAQIRALLLVAVLIFSAGILITFLHEGAGMRIAGFGLLAQAAWLARWDIARFTIRTTGAPRYMACALIAGYVWLAVGGIVWLFQGAPPVGGFTYDAMVHAIFLGFVFSMVFAHAPVIVPAVLSVALPYRPVLYLALVLLHGGLVMRVVGDWSENLFAWRWGGVLGELAIVVFLALSATLAIRARGRTTPQRRPAARKATTPA